MFSEEESCLGADWSDGSRRLERQKLRLELFSPFNRDTQPGTERNSRSCMNTDFGGSLRDCLVLDMFAKEVNGHGNVEGGM
jgi:hypothetical protein